MEKNFEEKLSGYADIIIRVGLNLRVEQRLLVEAPLEAADLVRLVTVRAYDAGARLVNVIWSDEQVTLARYRHAPRDSFGEYPDWMSSALEQTFRNGDALLSLHAEDPDLLKDQDPALIAQARKTAQQHNRAAMDLLVRNATNWLVVSMPIPQWAGKVFPGLPPADQIDQLWQTIFSVCRVDAPDPVAAWKDHLADLESRIRYLNARRYKTLHYTGPGTDLTIDLPEGHVWAGGDITSQNGIKFVPNIPTEEVFTLPHKDRVNGTVRASRSLSYGGTLIENFSITFKDGKVVDFSAEKGEAAFRGLLDTDEGACRLGEVALVPNCSPISQSGILFYNTLFDENAASHLALGEAYRFTLKEGEGLSEDTFVARGGNASLTHVDFMIGGPDTDIDGILHNGAVEAVMQSGEWA